MDVVGIEIPCIDLLVHVDRLPRENEGARLLEYSWQGGGKVATALVTLARLGAKTGVIGVLTGMFELTSTGITAAIVFGFLIALLFRPKG